MRSDSRWHIPAVGTFMLLAALETAPPAAAQVSCTVTYNCHGNSNCASAMGGQVTQRTLSFSSADTCNSQAATVFNGNVATCNCDPAASSNAPAAAPVTLNPILTNAAQTIGTALGQRLAQALLGGGNNAPAPVDPVLDAAQQQTALAAHQLNDSGIYLLKQRDYAGAINEFQKALALEPNDATIQYNLGFAKQAQKNAIVAGQTSDALGQLLGSDPAGMGSPGDALNLVNLGSGATPVNLRNATGTTIDPATLKGQLDSIFSNGAPISAPSDAEESDKLFQPSEPAPSSPLQGKIDKLNAQCAAVAPGSAEDTACKQERTKLEHADQQQLDEIFNGPSASGQNQAASPPQP